VSWSPTQRQPHRCVGFQAKLKFHHNNTNYGNKHDTAGGSAANQDHPQRLEFLQQAGREDLAETLGRQALSLLIKGWNAPAERR
jgi:hypothetical protein